MADFSFSEDEALQALNAQVLEDPEDFERWERLVQAAEAQEGRLNRNSSPGAIASTRDVYDKFLARFPLFFGYWKKYADLEFAIAGTESAEMVYERGIASIGTSVDLWTSYCSFKVETSHDYDVIRELFERGAESVGLDFQAHPFWDKYLEFEDRLEAHDRAFAILTRIVAIPMHQYARYFERYRNVAAKRPLHELGPPQMIEQFRAESMAEAAPKQRSEQELETEIRAKIDKFQYDVFQRTQTETTDRWPFEEQVKRPYYVVAELDEPQLANWRRYLDFEETKGDYARIKFLYERCLVSAANYEEFWLRYARWMSSQSGKEEEVRNIYQRASCLYVPGARPAVRLFYAQFEESQDRPDVAVAIHDAVLMKLPNNVETIISLANVHRRQYGIDAAVAVLKEHMDGEHGTPYTRGVLISEWARLLWKAKGDVDAARKVYESSKSSQTQPPIFWSSWLDFEMQQPTSADQEQARHERVQAVYRDIRHNSGLPVSVIKDLSAIYFKFLSERGGKHAMKEFLQLDREINGSPGVAGVLKEGDAGKDAALQNGTTFQAQVVQPGMPVNGSQGFR